MLTQSHAVCTASNFIRSKADDGLLEFVPACLRSARATVKRLACLALTALTGLTTPSVAKAKITLPAILSSNAVLQRGRQVAVWGLADDGETVTVEFAGQRVSTTAKDGRWQVQLQPLNASAESRTMTITGNNTIVLTNLLVGEVWLCSGQSNMEFPVGYDYGAYSGATNWQQELQHANFPNVRLLTVENSFALSPQFNCNGSWSLCNSNTAKTFSAVAFFFGRELHEQLKVPVGLVDSDFGGTVCEAWTSADTLKQFPDFAAGLKTVEMERDHSNELAQAAARELSNWAVQIEAAANLASVAKPGLDDSSWKVAPKLDENQPYLGFINFRRTFILPDGWEGDDLELQLGPVDDMDFTYLNGVKIGQTVGANQWTLPRTYSISKSQLRPGANVLTVCVLNTGGPGGISGPARLHPVNGTDSLALDQDWRFQTGPEYASLPQLDVSALADANTPSVLFNAMIAPLVPFGIRGAIWYQGESNVGRAAQYRWLFPAMIADWRRHWGEGDFPFYFVQIAPFHYPNVGLASALREAQASAMSVPNTGMAVTMDSDSNNLHPRNKQPVGHRLALWALAKTYGRTNLVYSGPIYRSMKIEGHKIRLLFDHVGGGLTAYDETLKHFTIAGDDEKFVPAKAKIEGDTIVVSSPAVPYPSAVRYAWGDGDEASFGNREGLPAPLFRTDAPADQ